MECEKIMYLISNKNIENGSKIDREEYRDNLFLNLSVENIYHEKLIESYSSRCNVSPTGDVVYELLDDYEYILSLYDYIYEVEKRDDELFVTNKLDNGDYVLKVIKLIKSSKKDKDNLYRIAEVLEKKVVEEDKLLPVLELVKDVVENLKGYEYGFVYLFRTIDEIIPNTCIKRNYYMNFLCKCLVRNIENIGLITDEEKLFLEKCFQEYCVEEYENLNLEKLIIEEMPF